MTIITKPLGTVPKDVAKKKPRDNWRADKEPVLFGHLYKKNVETFSDRPRKDYILK